MGITMAKTKAPLTISFRDKDGIRQYHSYPEDWDEGLGEEFDPQPFVATMRLIGTRRGRSAAQFVLEDQTTKSTYPMFLTGVEKMLEVCDVKKGAITGWWHWGKRGANFAIFYSPTEPE
jgi:hypothetical protein